MSLQSLIPFNTMLESVSCCHSPKGYDFVKGKRRGWTCSQAILWFSGHSSFVPYVKNTLFHSRPSSVKVRMNNCTHDLKHIFGGTPSPPSVPSNLRGLNFSYDRLLHQRRSRIHATVEVASAIDVINDLGLDTLTFLAVTVMVVPTFKIFRASPILGFFFAGVVLNRFALIRNLTDVKVLSEWGILFLVFFSTLAFTAFELPPNGAVGTKILEFLFHSGPDLVNIRSVDEAI